MARNARFGYQLVVRVQPGVVTLLDALMPYAVGEGGVNRSDVARMAILAGLDVLERRAKSGQRLDGRGSSG